MRKLFAALLLTASLGCQTCFFSGGNAWVRGDPLLPCDWNGKPALLVVVPPGDFFLNMGQAGYPNPDRLTFTLEAVYAVDARPCAPLSKLFLNQDDNSVVSEIGDIGQDGTLLNLAPRVRYAGTPVDLKLEQGNPLYAQVYSLQYCAAVGPCVTNCPPFWAPQYTFAVLSVR